MQNNRRTKLFFDTEFTGLHQGTKLISIGLVSEYGNTFYAENSDFDSGFKTAADRDWVFENVVPKLRFFGECNGPWEYTDKDNNKEMFGSSSCIAEELGVWLQRSGNGLEDPIWEIWSDTLAYDWILFNDLWGHAFSIPANVYYIPFDIATLLHLKGVDPDINRERFASVAKVSKHNALWDALVIKACYEKAMSL